MKHVRIQTSIAISILIAMMVFILPLHGYAEAVTDAPVVVHFEKMPAGLTLKVYSYAEDGSVREHLPDEDGAYALAAGAYCYDASCDGYASVSGVPFQVQTPAEEGECQQLVWLLSDERAAMDRSEGVVLFGVRSNGEYAPISAALQALLDELGVISADYFYTSPSKLGGHENVFYGTMDNNNVWYAVDMLLRHLWYLLCCGEGFCLDSWFRMSLVLCR